MIKLRILLPFLLSAALGFVYAQVAHTHPKETVKSRDPKALVAGALSAMGGEENLRQLKSVGIRSVGHTNLLGTSERDEGPWYVHYERREEIFDLVQGRRRSRIESSDAQNPEPVQYATVVATGVAAAQFDGKMRPASFSLVQETEETLALGPERLLLTALAASDLRCDDDAVIQSEPHQVVSFTWRMAPVRVFLNVHTSLPTTVEIRRPAPYNLFEGVWGDVTMRTHFSYWTLEANGVRYPRQQDAEMNGQPASSRTVTALKWNVELPSDGWAIPDDVRKAALERGKSAPRYWDLEVRSHPPQEIAPQIVKIPGRNGYWGVALIRQSDGVVVVEAPISSEYSAQVIAEANRRFPGLPIKAVISTSDAWPHLGGIREYAARAIPIYVLDRNRPLAQRLLDAPFQTHPDALAKTPRRADLRIVSGKTVIGDGENQLEAYPIRSESGERMLMVYAPHHRLLYGADLVQKIPDGSFFMPQYLTELLDAASREKLRVERIFAMHSNAVSQEEVRAAIQKAGGRWFFPL